MRANSVYWHHMHELATKHAFLCFKFAFIGFLPTCCYGHWVGGIYGFHSDCSFFMMVGWVFSVHVLGKDIMSDKVTLWNPIHWFYYIPRITCCDGKRCFLPTCLPVSTWYLSVLLHDLFLSFAVLYAIVYMNHDFFIYSSILGIWIGFIFSGCCNQSYNEYNLLSLFSCLLGIKLSMYQKLILKYKKLSQIQQRKTNNIIKIGIGDEQIFLFKGHIYGQKAYNNIYFHL